PAGVFIRRAAILPIAAARSTAKAARRPAQLDERRSPRGRRSRLDIPPPPGDLARPNHPMLARLLQRWQSQAGYRQILKVAFPLILSSGAISIMLFVDRMMLSWDSNESIAAALPSGV